MHQRLLVLYINYNYTDLFILRTLVTYNIINKYL